MTAISALPAGKRERWAAYFAHLVFRHDSGPGDHLTKDTADLLTTPDAQQIQDTLRELLAALTDTLQDRSQ